MDTDTEQFQLSDDLECFHGVSCESGDRLGNDQVDLLLLAHFDHSLELRTFVCGSTRDTFLTDDTCEDPLKDIEKDGYIKKAREQYGNSGAKQAQALTAELSGLFAGGDIAEEDMDAMMKAVMDAYWIAKAKNKKFAPKKAQTDK